MGKLLLVLADIGEAQSALGSRLLTDRLFYRAAGRLFYVLERNIGGTSVVSHKYLYNKVSWCYPAGHVGTGTVSGSE